MSSSRVEHTQGIAMRTLRRCLLLAGLGAASIGGFWGAWCLLAPGRSHRITLVVPNGYRGVIRVRFLVAGAPPLPRDRTGYCIRISADGVAVFSGRDVFLDWYQLRAQDASGRPMRLVEPNAQNRLVIGLRDAGITHDGHEAWFVLGNEDDLAEAVSQKVGMGYRWGATKPAKNRRTGQE